jgi:hypothetical protein
VAVGGVCLIVYSYIGILFNDRFNQIVAYFELTIGFGIGFGPTIGEFLNYIFNNTKIIFLTMSIFYSIY